MRYTAATCDPDDFERAKFSLRPFLLGRQTELFIVMTMYNEDATLFLRTMNAVIKVGPRPVLQCSACVPSRPRADPPPAARSCRTSPTSASGPSRRRGATTAGRRSVRPRSQLSQAGHLALAGQSTDARLALAALPLGRRLRRLGRPQELQRAHAQGAHADGCVSLFL